ncbi:MAG: pilus assembly protein [Alphaproteobacteria bacterium]|nr:pilus assembly protein [Alphaproteobacteria bacterium]
MKQIRKIYSYFLRQEGASAVEFALIAPGLLLMLVGTFDIGLYIVQKMQVQNVVEVVASYVVDVGSDDNVQVVAQESYGGDFSALTVTSDFECECSDGVVQACPVTCAGADDYQRRFVNIGATSHFTPLFPYPVLSSGIDINVSARMRVD